MINQSRIVLSKSHVRFMCTPRRLPKNLNSWPGNRQTKITTGATATTVAKKYNIKNDKIYTDKWMEGFLPDVKSGK